MSFANYAILILFHPIEFFTIVKRERHKFKPFHVIVLFALLIIMNYSYIFIVNFAMGTKRPIDANLLLEIVIVVLPLILWVIAAYAVTAVVTGECKLTELLTASAFCYTPLIVFTPFFGVLSRILTSEEVQFYNAARQIITLWVIILLFIALMKLNDYSLGKTLFVTFLAIVAMAIICAVGVLLFSLTTQLVYFFKDLWMEFNLKYLY